MSEETLRLQRSVEQMAAAQEVADLEYRVGQSDLSPCKSDWTREPPAGTMFRTHVSKPASVTIRYRMLTFSWNVPA